MPKDKYYGKTLRKNYARHEEVMAMPDLLEVQRKSYRWFLETGLQEVFADVAAITDYAGNLELSFIDYTMDEKPKYDVEECKARDATYAAPLKVRVRLHNKETGWQSMENRDSESGGQQLVCGYVRNPAGKCSDQWRLSKIYGSQWQKISSSD